MNSHIEEIDNPPTSNSNNKVEFVELTGAVEQGHAKAQYNLGLCYYYGNGVTQDDEEAEKWHKKAEEQGYARAKEALEEFTR